MQARLARLSKWRVRCRSHCTPARLFLFTVPVNSAYPDSPRATRRVFLIAPRGRMTASIDVVSRWRRPLLNRNLSSLVGLRFVSRDRHFHHRSLSAASRRTMEFGARDEHWLGIDLYLKIQSSSCRLIKSSINIFYDIFQLFLIPKEGRENCF